MRIWHLTFDSEGRSAFFPGEGLRRAAVHRIVRITRNRLILFCIVDEHLHVLLFGSRAEMGRFAQRLLLSLRALTSVPINPARIRTINGQNHLTNQVPYFLGQTEHHNLPIHPALWSGSCFVDLIGARRIDGNRLRLGDALPRMRLRDTYPMVELPRALLVPPNDRQIRQAGSFRLVSATSAALACETASRGAYPSCRASEEDSLSAGL